MNVGEYNFIVSFDNSRTAIVQIFGNASPYLPLRKQSIDNSVLVDTYKIEVPNFYEAFDIPALNEWNFNLLGIFPTPIIL